MWGEIMDFNSIKRIVKKEGDEFKSIGTCFFVNGKLALTARHVVMGKEDLFIEYSSDTHINFKSFCDNKYDFAILEIQNPIELSHVYILDTSKIFDGEEWTSFGFPYRKIKGDLLYGRISIAETVSDDLYDIDLKMIPDGGLNDYRGFSGAPVVIDNYVRAMLVRKPDGISLGGVKIKNCISLLERHGIKYLTNHSVWLDKISRNGFDSGGKIFIERNKLLEDIEQFVINGDGLIIGEAGIGKSYTLKSLQDILNKRGIPTIYTAIDSFACASDQEFRDEFNLKVDEDLISKLQRELSRVELINQKSVIIFDSFDSARNDLVKQRFLNLIKKIKEKLGEKVNLIVSCRIHDAKVSPSLQELFPAYYREGKYNNHDIHCRHFAIGELTEIEVLSAIKQLNINSEIYARFSNSFKNILKNPFYLWLLEKCIELAVNPFELGSIDSEIQLLDMFWDKRINSVRKDAIEAILFDITRKMVLDRSLIVNKKEIFQYNIQEEWNLLFTNSIIKYSNKLNSKISFSHNILFDYAVAKVLLTNEIERFISFVEEDTSRVVFLRPSLMYFFNSIWFYEQEEFWNIIFQVMASTKLPTITKFIPIHTVVTLSKSINDLTTLIDRWNNQEPYSSNIIKYILEAIDVFDVLERRIWVELIDQLYDKNEEEFIGLIAYTLRKIVDINQLGDDVHVKEVAGNISRYLYLDFKRNNLLGYGSWKRDIAVRSLIPIICKTFSTNAQESKEIIKGIIDDINISGDNVDLVSSITTNIQFLFVEDYNITEYVYKNVHTALVTSSEITNINTSSIIPLTSNRKQDFNMCKYRLYSIIDKLIEIQYEQGLRLALRTLNIISLQKKPNYKSNSSVSVRVNNRLGFRSIA